MTNEQTTMLSFFPIVSSHSLKPVINPPDQPYDMNPRSRMKHASKIQIQKIQLQFLLHFSALFKWLPCSLWPRTFSHFLNFIVGFWFFISAAQHFHLWQYYQKWGFICMGWFLKKRGGGPWDFYGIWLWIISKVSIFKIIFQHCSILKQTRNITPLYICSFSYTDPARSASLPQLTTVTTARVVSTPAQLR